MAIKVVYMFWLVSTVMSQLFWPVRADGRFILYFRFKCSTASKCRCWFCT